MKTTFKGEYVSFWIRLIKKLAPIVLLLLLVFLKVEYGKRLSNISEYRMHIYIFMIVCFVFGLFYHIRDIRTVVTEVSFLNEKLQIRGYDFNSTFEDTLDIDKVFLDVKEKNKSHLYIEIFSGDKYYYLNNYSDWQRQTLIAFLNEYKLKSKKIITGLDSFPEIHR